MSAFLLLLLFFKFDLLIWDLFATLLISSISATGGVFGPQGESGSEPEDDGQMKFYTEQHRGRRRSKGTAGCRRAAFRARCNYVAY